MPGSEAVNIGYQNSFFFKKAKRGTAASSTAGKYRALGLIAEVAEKFCKLLAVGSIPTKSTQDTKNSMIAGVEVWMD